MAIARKLLQKFKISHPHRTVRTDQGKELGKSTEFRDTVAKEGFVIELTGAEASSQNGLVEAPNKIFTQMMRCALYSADLGPENWSYALRMAVYIKNRLPYSSISNTPHQQLTERRADISELRIFVKSLCPHARGRQIPKTRS